MVNFIQERLRRLRDEIRISNYYETIIIIVNNEIERIGRQNQAAQPIMEALNYFLQNYNRLLNDMQNEINQLNQLNRR